MWIMNYDSINNSNSILLSIYIRFILILKMARSNAKPIFPMVISLVLFILSLFIV